jgi:hypothetical protein
MSSLPENIRDDAQLSGDGEAARGATTTPGLGSRSEIQTSLGSRRTPLTIGEMRDLSRRLRALGEPSLPLRVAVLRTYTSELLRPYWQFEALLQGFDFHLYEAPYGALLQEAEPGSALVTYNADLVYLFLRWEDLEPRLGLPVAGLRSGRRCGDGVWPAREPEGGVRRDFGGDAAAKAVGS